MFFSGCNLNCVYCQNYVISSSGRGETYSDGRLLDKLFELEREGAHNINLVTPSHYATRLAPLLEKFKASSSLPVVYNSGGYDSVEALKRLDGLVDIYLPDMKYGSDRTGEKIFWSRRLFLGCVVGARRNAQTASPRRFR